MGALPKFEPRPRLTGIAKVTVIDGRQAVLLPENVHVDATELDVLQHGTDLTLKPARKRLTPHEIEQWMTDMQRFQEELGDFMPEGRNQPPMPGPTEEFKRFFKFEDTEG
jgi:virulence-associated protein VagC